MLTPPVDRCSRVIVLLLVSVLHTASAQVSLPPTARSFDPIMEIWAGMHAAGMIDDAQFEYVSDQGTLPPDTTVQNSPLPVEQQAVWTDMEKKGLVTAEELVHMLFEGKLPNLTPDEARLFEDLAPVFEPDRSKRLTHDIRRKHQQADLIRMKYRASKRWTARYEAAVVRAQAEGLPLRFENEKGQVALLIAYDYDRPLYIVTCNQNAAATISTDKVRPGGNTPFDLTGANVISALWDVGAVRASHQEFATERVSLGESVSENEHSTRVAGTMVAMGVVSNAQGMAKSANLISYDLFGLISEMADCVISNWNIQVSNHSYSLVCGWDNVNLIPNQWIPQLLYPRWWGDIRLSEEEDYLFGFYNYLSSEMDDFCYAAPYHLPVYAAGNDRDDAHLRPNEYPYHYVRVWPQQTWVSTGRLRSNDGNPAGFDTITPHGVSKNILTVGAVTDIPMGYTNGATVTLEWYSATGPTDDGRVKPDVVANGQSVYTTSALSDTTYGVGSGTSYASPSVAGSIVLLQALHEQIYGNEVPMLASTLKALVVHTADDAGNPGPDYQFG